MKLYKELSLDEQCAWLAGRGEPAYRVRQIDEWLYARWVTSFTEMTNLGKPTRDALAAEFAPFALNCLNTQQAGDGTRKFLLELGDKETVESVLIPAPRRNTVCVSTQVGCPVRCVFCASGQGGFVRNLAASEIVDQVIFACRELKERVNNIVVMGMGEPLLNLDNLVSALETICAADKLGVGARHITISTSGIVPGIRRLADLGRQWNLALSLHSATEGGRAKLIPTQHRFPLPEILEACRYYREKTSRMVTLEYALIQGQNDSRTDAEALSGVARDLRAKVNLIPYNSTGKGKFAPPDRAAVRRFSEDLVHAGVQVSIRKEMGTDIRAACGQLRAGRPLVETPA